MTIHSIEKNIRSPGWFLAGSLLGSNAVSRYGRGRKIQSDNEFCSGHKIRQAF